MKPVFVNKLKRAFLVIILLIVGFFIYFIIITRNATAMTGRQKFLKAVYPVFAGLGKLFAGSKKVKSNTDGTIPPVSFYTMKAISNNGGEINFDSLKGKKILLVNTASDCGYTAQYAELQQLFEQNKGKLVIIGFPANDFHEQEKGTDQDIEKFCKANYGVSFPLASKSSVVRSAQQNKIFEWLSDKTMNGWNDQQPAWNFSKYLVNEYGVLTDYFEPYVSPLGSEMKAAIRR